MEYQTPNQKPQEGQCESFHRNPLYNHSDPCSPEFVRCGRMGMRRFDNTLDSGIHCDDDWERLLTDCRKRSW